VGQCVLCICFDLRSTTEEELEESLFTVATGTKQISKWGGGGLPATKIDDMICSVVFHDCGNSLSSIKSHDFLCDEFHGYRQIPIVNDKVGVAPR